MACTFSVLKRGNNH